MSVVLALFQFSEQIRIVWKPRRLVRVFDVFSGIFCLRRPNVARSLNLNHGEHYMNLWSSIGQGRVGSSFVQRSSPPKCVRFPLNVLAVLILLVLLISAPARALVFDSTYQTAIDERDQARVERDRTRQEFDEEIKAHNNDLKIPNPALEKQLEDAARRLGDADRRQDIISNQLMDMQRGRGLWEAVAISAFVVGPIMGCVIGLAIGTKTKNDYVLQQSANVPPKVITDVNH
jgi:hypothetical protein